MKYSWIKWYPAQWLHSTARDEMTAEERATFQDFVCLSALNKEPGEFKFVNFKSLSRQLNTDEIIIEKTIKKCIDKKRIELFKDDEGYICKILKWHIYQAVRKVDNDDVNNKTEKDDLKLTLNDLDKIRGERGEKKRGDKNKGDKNLLVVNEIDKILTQHLIDMMLANNPDSSIIKRLTEKRQLDWINQCRLMRERDERTPEQIRWMIDFSQNDEFWKTNILSMTKLREKFDQLWLKAEAKVRKSPFKGIKEWLEEQTDE